MYYLSVNGSVKLNVMLLSRYHGISFLSIFDAFRTICRPYVTRNTAHLWGRKMDVVPFYRAMQFSANRGIAIACRLSVCPSVCLSVTLVDCDHIGWNSSKIISPLVGCSLFATPTRRVCSKGNNTRKFGHKVTYQPR